MMVLIRALAFSGCSRIVISTCLLLGSIPASAATLTISLDNPPQSGTIEFQLYDSANAFGALRKPVKTVRYSVDGGDPYIIDNLPPGEYALLVYHDENDSNSIDKNFIGIPIEFIGFSNRYAPKAPPSFSRAAFVIEQDQTRHIDVELYLPLGKSGRLGVGAGVIARTSPYREYSGGVYQFIPAITYTGERLQVFGPRIQFGIAGSGKLRLALAGQYRIGVYQEVDSPFLAGMGDREDTFLAGLAVQAELPGVLDLELAYEYDVLDRIGGGVARLVLSKVLQSGIFRFTPQLGVNYMNSEIANYDFGVPADRATVARPSYELDSTTSVEAGVGLFIEITREWLFVMDANIEKFSDEVTNSPIVDQDYVIKGFAAINYVF
ncbi:MAG: MipA/OmpV family protein [Gammaproteobacteria bacterium]|jgi:outer membrane protein